MTLIGNDAARAAFAAAVGSGALHHAWLLTGPEGVGKASFAREAAIGLLAAREGRERTEAMIASGAHHGYRELVRLPKDADKPDQDIARSIVIKQVRGLQPLFGRALEPGERRVVVIDAIDDLERNAANALLKNLEEPPAGTIFLLVSHAPGKLLPTIRSRCRLLRFEPMREPEVAAALRTSLPEADDAEIATLVAAAEGAPGRGLRFAGLDLGAVDQAIASIAGDGDRDNGRRTALARQLAGKAAQPRYEAFLDRAPAFIARQARVRTGHALRIAIDAHAAARDLAGAARGLSLDPQATVIEMAGIVARLHDGAAMH